MNPDKYYWTNRASIHHIERLKDFLPADSDPEQILHTGKPRYIEHIEEQIISHDGHRRYDLLIEYDIYHPSHGIYFGCRETSLPGFDHSVETTTTLKEWNAVLPLSLRRLNNVFPEKDFSCRLRDTDNDNDRTFWPFWISLHEDESPHDVARIALRIIATAYRDYADGKGLDVTMSESKAIHYPAVRTAFTRKAYESFLKRLAANVAVVSELKKRDSNIQTAVSMFEIMISKLEERGVLTRLQAYEYAWSLNEDIADVEFTALIKTFFEELRIKFCISQLIKIPWKDLIRLILRHDESPFKEQIKTMKPQHDTIEKVRAWIEEII